MNRSDIYTEVTDTIIKAIEDGQANGRWELPWHGYSVMPHNAVTKKHYRGVNVPLLWIRQQRGGFQSGLWATYRQWLEVGAQVRKGEKGSPVVFWKTIDVEPHGEDESAETRMFARYSTVFNAAQVDGFEIAAPAPRAEITLKDDCTRFVAATKANIEHGHPMACYSVTDDKILMPEPSLFRDTKAATATVNYFSTLSHELTHWVGARHRLDRIQHKKFGDSAYAFEELVAELGAAMLCTSLGVTPAPRDDHAQYVKNWLRALNDDKRFIFSAASQAQKAVDYLYSLQPQEQEAAA
ncbi:MAG: zincin-like metallopeptidase domain-containing protein [Pseudomonadota bacterium]